MDTFVYQVIRSSWGIVVRVGADFVPLSSNPGNYADVTSQLGVADLVGLPPVELTAFLRGAAIIAPRIEQLPARPDPMILQLREVSHNLTDFQTEGLTCAAIGLIARKYDLPEPEIGVRFDRTRNRYEFDFG